MTAKLFPDSLPKEQGQLWELFQANAEFLSQNGFYLAGGTALALQIGHRKSVDFDFFSQTTDTREASVEWIESFPQAQVREADAKTLHAEIQGVKVSLIGGYKYPVVDSLVKVGSVSMAGILDIGLMKLLALTHRAALRDYLDMAAILKNHVSLPELLHALPRKYGPSLNGLMVLRALVSFEDVDQDIPQIQDQTLLKSWQDILRKAVKAVS